MFDFANSSYTTIIVTVAFSLYFTRLVAPGPRADFLWSLGVSWSNLIVILVSPILGAMADDLGRKKLFLFGTYVLCCGGTAALWFVQPGQVTLALLLFVVSNVGYSLGENLAAAFLPEISTPQNIGRISGFGWGLGYFGGLLCLVVVMPFLKGDFRIENLANLRLAWLATALFFLLAALPTFLVLRERAPRGPRRILSAYAAESVRRISATFRSLKHFSELTRFLLIFLVYSCGLTTIIAFATIFASNTLGFTAQEVVVLFIALQLSSAVGAFFFGWIQDRAGARRTIQVTLVLWIGVCAAAFFCQTKGFFWVVALSSGFGIGSLQSASRAMVGLFAPLEKSGEFFAFWGLAGKGAYILGPLVFGAISSISGSQRLAILATSVFFLAGLIGMSTVDEKRGHEAALEWTARAKGAPAGAEAG